MRDSTISVCQRTHEVIRVFQHMDLEACGARAIRMSLDGRRQNIIWGSPCMVQNGRNAWTTAYLCCVVTCDIFLARCPSQFCAAQYSNVIEEIPSLYARLTAYE